MSKIAVIATGGKQYFVHSGDKIKVEKLAAKDGDSPANASSGVNFTFDKVLMVSDDKGKEVQVGKPYLKDAKVEAKILKQDRADKVRVVHYKAKTRQHKVYGHRQPYTQIEITSINPAPFDRKSPGDKDFKRSKGAG